MKDIHEQLTKYLTDAHSIEEQALSQLKRAPDIAGEPRLAAMLREHYGQTEGHESRVKRLLEARDASPSRGKDAVMWLGGKGFLAFAWSQPDTPGKLATHALSYEALEWASYDLLARTAEAAGEAEVAREARGIRDEERVMMKRLESVFDATADASLEKVDSADFQDTLGTYLADAHAIEAQSIQLLESAVEHLEEQPDLRAAFAEHLEESRTQQKLLEQRLDAHGGKPSRLKDAALRFGAVNWGTFFAGHPDTSGKIAAFAYAVEFLEIGGYEHLLRVARRAGATETVSAVERIIAQERAAAEKIAGLFDAAVRVALAEQGAG